MEKILKESIDFSKSPDFNTDDLAVEVKKASIDRETLVLKLELELNFIVSAISAENIRTNIKRAMPDIRDVELNITYKDVKGSEIPAPEKKAKKSNGNGTNGGNGNGSAGGMAQAAKASARAADTVRSRAISSWEARLRSTVYHSTRSIPKAARLPLKENYSRRTPGRSAKIASWPVSM